MFLWCCQVRVLWNITGAIYTDEDSITQAHLWIQSCITDTFGTNKSVSQLTGSKLKSATSDNVGWEGPSKWWHIACLKEVKLHYFYDGALWLGSYSVLMWICPKPPLVCTIDTRNSLAAAGKYFHVFSKWLRVPSPCSCQLFFPVCRLFCRYHPEFTHFARKLLR